MHQIGAKVRAVVRYALVALLLASGGGAWACTGMGQRQWRPPQRAVLPLVEEIRPPSTDMRFVQRCPGRPYQPARTGPWVRAASERLSQEHGSAHQSYDQIVTTGQPVILRARLAYGTEPLTDEWVRVFFGSCEKGWTQVGHVRTDEQGRAVWRLARELQRGSYDYVMQVVGDRSFVRGTIWVIAPEVRAVAFSTAALITPGAAPEETPEALVRGEEGVDEERALGEEEAQRSEQKPSDSEVELVPGALALAGHYARQGYLVVYLSDGSTGRELTAERLQALGFPGGPFLRAAEVQEAWEPEPPGDVWDDASERSTGGGPTVPIRLTRHFVDQPDRARLWAPAGLSAQEVVELDPDAGWEALIQTLDTTARQQGDGAGARQIIRPEHRVPNYPRRSPRPYR
ncbi:hypothetical protein DL240_03255 [Lujinxingia litoralis]|uniref:Uncharacterized protein n=1 Tax=Lujinxingia litoralis TaxID=2211119 RepID=A0A328CAR1_9DELT|nr:hypothetical protein [Lujinxingia litoralis]RAL25242.1 hypothetical protein DL240_03255 [Lujinxingia litoralis]